MLHKIHRHSQLILDPESACYDHFRGGEAPSEVVVVSRFRIQDQVAVAVDFMQNTRTFGQKLFYLTKIEVRIPHHVRNITWATLAQDEEFWNQMEEKYVQWVLGAAQAA